MKFAPKPTPLPPPLLDVGEGWAVVIGLKAVLSKRVEQLTEAQFAEAAKIHDTIERRAKSLVNGGIVPGQIAIVNYPKALDETSGDMDEAQIVAMIAPLPPNDQGPYISVATRQYRAVQAVIPKLTYSTLAGDQALTPNLSELVDFSDFYAMLDDPLTVVFGMMANGSLNRMMAKAFREVFPTLSVAISSAVDDAIAVRFAKNQAFTLPWKVEIGIEAWRDMEPAIPAPSLPPPPPQEEPADGGGGGSGDKTALSPAERLDAAG